jgi:hypothetical protein
LSFCAFSLGKLFDEAVFGGFGAGLLFLRLDDVSGEIFQRLSRDAEVLGAAVNPYPPLSRRQVRQALGLDHDPAASLGVEVDDIFCFVFFGGCGASLLSRATRYISHLNLAFVAAP